jgi:hypothetical protein
MDDKMNQWRAVDQIFRRNEVCELRLESKARLGLKDNRIVGKQTILKLQEGDGANTCFGKELRQLMTNESGPLRHRGVARHLDSLPRNVLYLTT